MKKSTRILSIIVLILGMLICSSVGVLAQNVVLQKKVFVQSNDSTDTGYEYQTRDGKKYTVYLSKNGKAFIVKWSEKKQKWYRQYLPKITQMLQEMEKDGKSK
jgi:hypothetical protein